MVVPPKTKSRLHKKKVTSTAISPTRTPGRIPTSEHTPSSTSKLTPNSLQEASDKNTKLTRKVRDLLKLKATYAKQIADLKSTNKQLKSEFDEKQDETHKECALIIDNVTKSRLSCEKLHAGALAQLIAEIEGKDNRISAMIDLHDQLTVRKCLEMRAVTEKAKVDRKTSNLVSHLYFNSKFHNFISFVIISHLLLSFHLFLPTLDHKQSIE